MLRWCSSMGGLLMRPVDRLLLKWDFESKGPTIYDITATFDSSTQKWSEYTKKCVNKAQFCNNNKWMEV